MHLNSKLLFQKYATEYFKSGMSVLEIGPAGAPSAYKIIVNDNSIVWHTIDFENSSYIDNANKNLTYTLNNAYEFPVENQMYDIVVSGQVIEHVEQPWIWLKEIIRVLKSGGLVITINPVSWPFHEAPVDCWRIFPSGISALAEFSGLTVLECFFSSLEIDNILKIDNNSKFFPGRSYDYSYSKKQLRFLLNFNRVIKYFPVVGKWLIIPIEVSYDTFSVLKKK